MSLQFDELSLKNFGPYRSVNGLELTTTSEAPAVLVYGENTIGKTTLFSALRWCLYGTFQPQQTQREVVALLPERLNRKAERDGETDLEVRLRFTADGQVYNLARRATFANQQIKVSTDLRIGAQVIPQSAVDAEIGRLLHPQISEFFLFDAELMGRFYDRLQTDRERAVIRESIEKVLGVPALQRAERDVADLAEHAADRQSKAASQVAEAGKLRRQLTRLKSEIESGETSLEESKEDLDKARTQLNEITAQLRAVEGLQGDIREQETLEAALASGAREDAELRREMRDLLTTGWISLAVPPLRRRATEVESQNSRAQSAQEKINRLRTRVAVLEDRVRGGVCPTCEQPLPPPDAATTDELEEAKRQLRELTGGSSGSVDLVLERRLRGLIDDASPERYADKQQRLNELRALQYQRQRNLDQIKDRLQGNDAAEIRGLGSKRTRLEQSVRSLTRSIEEDEAKLTKLRGDHAKATRQLGRLPGADPAVVLESNFFGFTHTLLTRAIQQYREKTRAQVQGQATDMFGKLVRDPAGCGGLRISQDYRVELLDPAGRPRETSEGGKQLVALSLIGALKQAAVRGGPVVLDSPLARLDLGHRANVLQTWVQALGTQVMLFVQSGELTQEQAREIMGNSIGREYRLVRPTNDPELVEIEAM